MTQTDHRSAHTGGRRGARGAAVLVPLVLGLIAVGLAACSSETVTPSTAPAAYVALGSGVANPGSMVDVVDTVTGHLGHPIAVGTLPSAVALLPGAKDLLVTIKAQDQLVEVSTSTGKVVNRIGVGLEPDAVAVTPAGTLALVANFGDNTVTPVHLGTFTASAVVPVGRQPVAIAISPGGTQALVAD
jgi:YVTN family beta-propeller protein